jgi:hypothetical protein
MVTLRRAGHIAQMTRLTFRPEATGAYCFSEGCQSV